MKDINCINATYEIDSGLGTTSYIKVLSIYNKKNWFGKEERRCSYYEGRRTHPRCKRIKDLLVTREVTDLKELRERNIIGR